MKKSLCDEAGEAIIIPCSGLIKACLALDLVANLSAALDNDNTVEAGPGMAFLKPGDIMDHGGGPCLDAAMIAMWKPCYDLDQGLRASHLAAAAEDVGLRQFPYYATILPGPTAGA